MHASPQLAKGNTKCNGSELWLNARNPPLILINAVADSNTTHNLAEDHACAYSVPEQESEPQRSRGRKRERRVKLLALDMDGTLLDGQSKVLPSSVDALHAALATGVKVCLATGKARPAALRAMEKVGLAGRVLSILSWKGQIANLSTTISVVSQSDETLSLKNEYKIYIQIPCIQFGLAVLLRMNIAMRSLVHLEKAALGGLH